MEIFLNSCVIIYWMELKEPFYQQFQKKLEQLNQQFKNAVITVSRLSYLECCVTPMKQKDKSLLKSYQDFFNSPSLNVVELDKSVIDTATKIRATTPLKTPDAIQAACALSCTKLSAFVTNDKAFKKVTQLPTHLI